MSLDTLKVHAESSFEYSDYSLIRVYWMSGKLRKSAIDIKLPLSCQDKFSAAELIAIRYVLGELKVYNAHRTGINLKIVVSKGAIKKMAKKSTSKFDLYEYGYPIFTRYAEAEISVSKDKSWYPSEEELGQVTVIDGESLRGIEKIHTESLGVIGISFHAMEKYIKHCGTIDMSRTWKNLNRRFNGVLVQEELPSNVLKHKLRKYGDAPEVWKHPDDTVHYVFCNRDDYKILVTVFVKAPEKPVTFFPSIVNKI